MFFVVCVELDVVRRKHCWWGEVGGERALVPYIIAASVFLAWWSFLAPTHILGSGRGVASVDTAVLADV